MTSIKKKEKELKILDCTIRDGGYINNWHFDKKLVREIYRGLSKSGVDYIEIGFRGSEKYFDREKFGLWRFSEEKDIAEVTSNIGGANLVLMTDYGKIDIEDLCSADESAVKLVRTAANKPDLKNAIEFLKEVKKKGYETSLNAMGYTNYSDANRAELVNMLRDTDLDYIYIADSYGSLFPDQIKPLFGPLLELPDIKVGFHPHNSLQMSFANTLEAIRCGIDIVDSTIYGMGRAAGNLPTEILISYFEREQSDKYNAMPLLNIIDRYFLAMQKENPWGYQLPYMLSGMFQCHPNYAKSLVDYREFTIEDIWKAMAYIKKQNPVGFSKPLLDELISTGHIGTIGNTANNGSAKSRDISKHPKPDYTDRFRDRDFLVLANGPTLKEYKPKIDKFIEKYDPIILGGNYLGKLFTPHFHAFNNKRRFAEYIETVQPGSKLLLGEYLPEEMVREYTSMEFEKIRYIDEFLDFGIENGIITTNCRTIAILLLGVSIAMGAKRVFAAGMDGYMGTNDMHFYKEQDEKEDFSMIIERHQWCHKYIEQIDEYLINNSKEGIHILTPTSYKNFYKGIENYL